MADLLHLVDKPEGWTSHDAVARLRRILGERRVGHAGTLDPFATGLLVVAEGRATGLLGALSLLPKRYLATLRLGVATDTQDRTGTPISVSRDPLPTLGAFDDALARFRGRLEQRPPLYSAVKVAGERLYRAARRGEEVERPTRPIHVYALERVASPESGAATLPTPAVGAPANTADVTIDVTVSRGTYVRTLAHDLGAALGCGAHLVALRRVSIGPFHVSGAGRVEKESGWDAARLRACAIPPAKALGFLPRVRLDASETTRLRHGAGPSIGAERIVESDAGYPLPPGAEGWPLALLDPEGTLLAVAEPWSGQTPGAPLRLQRVVAAPSRAAGDAEDATEAARA
ncbi:MAG TPA: tRNA pseudouridine(55) synthase TruB [Candidatus Eisenbacteria bacterium]|nr:tRNA pseudouridine(55) synthase TruB [Candidatus Eisenbacteria bacterium]